MSASTTSLLMKRPLDDDCAAAEQLTTSAESPAKIARKGSSSSSDSHVLASSPFVLPAPLKRIQHSIKSKHDPLTLAGALVAGEFLKAFAEVQQLSEFVMGDWSQPAAAAAAAAASTAAAPHAAKREEEDTKEALQPFASASRRPMRELTFTVLPPGGFIRTPIQVFETHRLSGFDAEHGFCLEIEDKSPAAPFGSTFCNRVLITGTKRAEGGTELQISSETVFTGDAGFFASIIEAGASANVKDTYLAFADELARHLEAEAGI